MKIGVTGTRNEITQKQMLEFVKLLNEMKEYQLSQWEFHHGDCVGADDTAARLAYIAGFKIVCHPPIKEDLRAYSESHETREPKGYFERNRAIVDEVDFLIVIPKDMERQDNGGTWYTYDYAMKKKVPVKILWPM